MHRVGSGRRPRGLRAGQPNDGGLRRQCDAGDDAAGQYGGAHAAARGTAGGATRKVDGALVSTRYGDVQVAATFSDNRVTEVEPLTLPTDRARSMLISQQAEPRLRQESIQVQSASITTLSGAAYTSEAWARSLSAALAVR